MSQKFEKGKSSYGIDLTQNKTLDEMTYVIGKIYIITFSERNINQQQIAKRAL
jgi:hypothetical protein